MQAGTSVHVRSQRHAHGRERCAHASPQPQPVLSADFCGSCYRLPLYHWGHHWDAIPFESRRPSRQPSRQRDASDPTNNDASIPSNPLKEEPYFVQRFGISRNLIMCRMAEREKTHFAGKTACQPLG